LSFDGQQFQTFITVYKYKIEIFSAIYEHFLIVHMYILRRPGFHQIALIIERIIPMAS